MGLWASMSLFPSKMAIRFFREGQEELLLCLFAVALSMLLLGDLASSSALAQVHAGSEAFYWVACPQSPDLPSLISFDFMDSVVPSLTAHLFCL